MFAWLCGSRIRFKESWRKEHEYHRAGGYRSRSPFNAFRLRRGQILLASARGERVSVIARLFNCDEQTVRNAIHTFNSRGLAALQEGSSRPHHIQHAFSAEQVEHLIAILHRQQGTRTLM